MALCHSVVFHSSAYHCEGLKGGIARYDVTSGLINALEITGKLKAQILAEQRQGEILLSRPRARLLMLIRAIRYLFHFRIHEQRQIE